MTDYSYINPGVFAFRLRSAMRKRKMTGRKLAEEIDRKESTIYQWTNGYQLPTLDTTIALADILDVSIDFLTGRTEVMEIGGSYA